MDPSVDIEIPVGVSDMQENFRIFELPPDLADRLERAEDHSLSLKSAETLSSSGLAQNSQQAVLCTTDTTYQLRQVHSSNSIFLLQAREILSPSSLSRGSLSIVGSSKTILEVTKRETVNGQVFLNLPLYSGSGSGGQFGRSSDLHQASGHSKAALCEHTPVSDTEFDNAWIDTAAFELGNVAYQPTVDVLLNSWTMIFQTMTAESIDPESPVLFDTLHASLPPHEVPEPVFKAILIRISSNQTASAEFHIDPKAATSWIGSLLLQRGSKEGQSMPVDRLLNLWRDLTPSKWQSLLSIDILKFCSFQASPTTIFYLKAADTARQTTGSTSNLATKPSARKWHDRFRQNK